MESPLPEWVEDAATLPVAFAQVREDPRLDGWVVEQLGPQARILMIASGGCTLAFLRRYDHLSSISVVDPNPAQIELARLKLRLLEECEPAERLALLGHAPVSAEERERKLGRLCNLDRLGPVDVIAGDGPDQAGRYERVFGQLRHELLPRLDEVENLLQLGDPAEQARRADPDTLLGHALDDAFDRAMALPILVRLFGEGATRNRVEPFARHFARRTRHALATLPAANNPYLWQVLLGHYPPEHPVDWLSLPRRTAGAEIRWLEGVTMAEAIRREAKSGQEFDFIHVSNILDWLSPEEARQTLDLVHGALRPGGWVLIRQLNSSLDIPAAGPGFDWQIEQAAKLHAEDRSYFYRAIHLGRRR
jgi:S-adenosylmethionine-diacylglycerol 3-amino-3-carboxypropyl transferase